eukprot:maker-scaffold171_size289870-snap-gene-1.32 protein:Tk00423 transcript:maker-scaffold171_size289870-snap-gene-1.32-mRNA-1 annotation:"rna-binding protein 26"
MLIENPEALKAWLTSRLEPLCDADPAALAKYVLALIKKDKAEVDLRKSMQAQMEVFLQTHTPTFIDLLFETVESKHYLLTPEPTPAVKAEPAETPTTVEGGEADSTTPEPESPGAGNPYLAKRARCRDYDEKGFCMRGDQCKFDHGNDAVVLEDTVVPGASTGVPAYQPASLSSTVYAEPYVPSGHATVSLPPLHLPPPGYNPGNPRKRAMDEPLMAYPPPKQSVHERLGGYQAPRGRGGRGRGGRGGRGGAHGGGSGSKQIAVRNIPPNMNNIAHLNNHFARFGNLVNVQVQFEEDPGSALVTFTSPGEASTAYNSPDAVLGNRFIRMHFYYSPEEKFGGHKTHHASGADGQNAPPEIEKTADEIEAEELRKSEAKAAAIAAVQKNQEMLEIKSRLKREQEERQQENLKKVTQIQKSKQDLLEKLIGEQKTVIETIESRKGSLKPEEKASMMTVLKKLSSSIEKAREDVKQAMQIGAVRKGPAELQKALLDAELELFQAQQDGSESVESIQMRVNHLRIEAAKTGNLPTSFSPRGMRGGYRGRHQRGYFAPRFRGGRGRGGRGYSMAGSTTTVDRRPTKIQVAGFESDEKDELVETFRKFGEIVTVIDDDANKSVVIQYKTRREAEIAMKVGSKYGDKTLQMTWSIVPAVDELSTELPSTEETVPDVSEAHVEEEDGYTPLDPHYLPPGLDDETKSKNGDSVAKHIAEEGEDILETDYTAEEADQLLYAEEEEEDDDDEEAEDDRSWKR